MPEPRPVIPEAEIRHLVDHLFRHRAGQLVATLTRIFGPAHLQLAEDVVQDAVIAALRQWPLRGVPDDPAAWLARVARNRALDLLRRDARFAARAPRIRAQLEARWGAADESPPAVDGEMVDDQLRMLFACCHPDIPREAHVALTLKTVGGFGVSEIARAYLMAEPAVAQRLVRAKRRIREADIQLQVPEPAELPRRLDSVLEVLYLMFNEGYAAHEGDELLRRDMCQEALRLCVLLAEHPRTSLPAVHALAALFCFQASRLSARLGAVGELVPLPEQDRSRWDRRLISRGLHHLERSAHGDALSSYHLQAEIACCHAIAPSHAGTDWPRILCAYDLLAERDASPVVALNRAVALAEVAGPAAGLAALDRVAAHASMHRYALLPGIRGEMHERLGQPSRAARCYREALALVSTEPERRFLASKLARAEAAAARPAPAS